MSNMPTLPTNTSTLSIGSKEMNLEHEKQLASDISRLLQSSDFSDVTIKVENREFFANRAILAARSAYFGVLFFGDFVEATTNVIELQETNADAFEAMLTYMYSGRLSLSEFTEDEVCAVLHVAHQYNILPLEGAIADYLRANLTLENVCSILNMATLFHLSRLVNACLYFMDERSSVVVKLPEQYFCVLSEDAACQLLSRSSFYASELEIFNMVVSYIGVNPEATLKKLLAAVRLELVSQSALLEVIRPANLFSDTTILDAISRQMSGTRSVLNARGVRSPEVNVASTQHGATCILGEIKDCILNGDAVSYDRDTGFTRHPIDATTCNRNNNGRKVTKGIVVSLGRHSVINNINILLWDNDKRSYRYYIEISCDDDIESAEFVPLIDYTQCNCRSWQKLIFKPCTVKFIRLEGTHNTENKVFHVVHLDAMYTEKPLKYADQYYAPTENVAHVSRGALVVDGVSHIPNSLLNGDSQRFDWDSGYTCHQLNSGNVTVQLAQPFMLASIRFRLWDLDSRRYSYSVSVSVDYEVWTSVFDDKNEYSSWQLITFEPTPVVYIRITGTYNSANEVFHIVHLEAPAQVKLSELPELDEVSLQRYKFNHPSEGES